MPVSALLSKDKVLFLINSGFLIVILNFFIAAQNQAFIIGSYAGAYKLAPTVGVGIADALNDEDPLLWRIEIAKQLRADGQIVHSIQITSTDMIINANYPSE